MDRTASKAPRHRHPFRDLIYRQNYNNVRNSELRAAIPSVTTSVIEYNEPARSAKQKMTSSRAIAPHSERPLAGIARLNFPFEEFKIPHPGQFNESACFFLS